MSPELFRRLGVGPAAPVVVERAGGGLSRPEPSSSVLGPIRRLTREATRVFLCDRAGVWRIEPDGTSPVCLTRYLRGEGRHEEGVKYPDAFGRHAALLLDRLTFLSMEGKEGAPPARPALARYLEGEGIRAILAVPIRPNGILRGFFALETTTGPREWNDDDRARAVAFAHQVTRIWDEDGAGPDHPSSRSDPRVSSTGPAGSPARDSEPISQAAEVTARGTEASPLHSDPTALSEPGPGDEVPASRGSAAATSHDPPRGAGEEITSTRSEVEAAPSGRRMEMRVRRLREMEGAGLLGIELASDLERLLSVQHGYLGLLDALEEEAGDEPSPLQEARELSERIRSRLLDFLDWSEDHARGRTPIELNAFLGELATRLGRVAGDQVRLLLSPASAPVRIQANRTLLERAVEHLVDNARKASDEGARVRVGVQPGDPGRESRAVRIVVEDTGHGISAEDLPWIFEPFYSRWRERDERHDVRRGVRKGGGLPFVQAVVEGHGGWVDVVSTPGEGTRFVLNLPVGPDSMPLLPEGAQATPEVEGRPVALVVEDDTDLSRLLARILQRGGFHALRCDSGVEVDRLLQRRGGDVALLVAGSRLEGGRTGAELAERGRLFVPGLPVLLVDGEASQGRAEDSVAPESEGEAGSPDEIPLLVPPFDPGTVLDRARAAVGVDPAGPGQDVPPPGEDEAPPVH